MKLSRQLLLQILRIDLKLPGQFLYVQISGNRITDLGNYADCCIQIAQKLGLIAQIQSLPQIAQAKCSRCFFGIFQIIAKLSPAILLNVFIRVLSGWQLHDANLKLTGNRTGLDQLQRPLNGVLSRCIAIVANVQLIGRLDDHRQLLIGQTGPH